MGSVRAFCVWGMGENLYSTDHKATTDAYREGYDRIFGRRDAPADKPADDEADE